eukprot:TRINITY_DN1349_c0_g1_i3.p1 TRINITY_DN1349_c0_g1~~TRINITY_DN1349_c0_g1_i3.p1  ORF type:complete len:103 (-),score=18.12 TRINITY_DN1349_c0_g1_i3:36-344(-)
MYRKERYHKAVALAQNSRRLSQLELSGNVVMTFLRDKLWSVLNEHDSTSKAAIKLWTRNIKDVLQLNGISIEQGVQFEQCLQQLKARETLRTSQKALNSWQI